MDSGCALVDFMKLLRSKDKSKGSFNSVAHRQKEDILQREDQQVHPASKRRLNPIPTEKDLHPQKGSSVPSSTPRVGLSWINSISIHWPRITGTCIQF